MPLIVVVVIAIVVCILVFGPFWYSRNILDTYAKPVDYLPGTGGQLAKHLIALMELPVTLEATEGGDHYDPMSRTVRLSSRIMDGSSLTAVAVAAHEVGHAIQHHSGSVMLNVRTVLVRLLRPIEIVASMLFIASPMAVSLSPRLSLGLVLCAFALLLSRILVHLVTLPVEFDASFGKALPILKKGQYVSDEDQRAIRKVLRACALTYVSAALMELLNIYRWLRFFRK